MNTTKLQWPSEGLTRTPYRLYSDPDIYAREQERVFGGPHWNFVGLSAEIPDPGDFKRAAVGEKPVVVTRTKDGRISVVENRCSHRGMQLCTRDYGNAPKFTCPYHQWTFDLDGNLRGIPFRKGLRNEGGMPCDFDTTRHGLTKLNVAERHGVIFASFSPEAEPFEEYLGPSMLALFDRVFDGRPLRILGHSTQIIPSNWKLLFENLKDPYHATLLHVFLVTFGLFRADQPSTVCMDGTGRHAALTSERGEQKKSAEMADINAFHDNLTLQDPRLLNVEREFQKYSVVIQTIWPNLIVQQQGNSLNTRLILPRGPNAFEYQWTYFGYADDSPEMVERRLRQANLNGPAGLVTVDDSEAMKMLQETVVPYAHENGLVELGGSDWRDATTMISEAAIRAFYDYYRRVMEL